MKSFIELVKKTDIFYEVMNLPIITKNIGKTFQKDMKHRENLKLATIFALRNL